MVERGEEAGAGVHPELADGLGEGATADARRALQDGDADPGVRQAVSGAQSRRPGTDHHAATTHPLPLALDFVPARLPSNAFIAKAPGRRKRGRRGHLAGGIEKHPAARRTEGGSPRKIARDRGSSADYSAPQRRRRMRYFRHGLMAIGLVALLAGAASAQMGSSQRSGAAPGRGALGRFGQHGVHAGAGRRHRGGSGARRSHRAAHRRQQERRQRCLGACSAARTSSSRRSCGVRSRCASAPTSISFSFSGTVTERPVGQPIAATLGRSRLRRFSCRSRA